MNKIEFFHTAVSGSAFQKVAEVLQSTFLSEGKVVAEFEKSLEHQLGIINPVCVNSGTAALHLAMVVAGIGAGDEVIIPAQTFIATGLAVMMVGAVPVFADIQYETGNIDPVDVEKKITPNTKAVIPVHWGGYPCDMDELGRIAATHNLVVIEDAAHAIGATYREKKIGAISPFTCFSFQAIKHLTTGDGGALACLDEEHFNRAKTLRWFGIDRRNSPPGPLGEREYNLSELGFKYHLNNYAAALGLANLDELEANLQRRREIAAFYKAELQGIPGIRLFKYQEDRESAFWLFGFHVENRDSFLAKMKDANIPTSVVHLGIHRNCLFSDPSVKTLPNQVVFDKTQINIPVHNALSDEDVDMVVKAIKAGW